MSGEGFTWVMVTDTPSRSSSRISLRVKTSAKAWRSASPTLSWRCEGPLDISRRVCRAGPRPRGERDILILRITEPRHKGRQHGKDRLQLRLIAPPLRQAGLRQAPRHLGAGRRVDRPCLGATGKGAHFIAEFQPQEIAYAPNF